MLQAQVAMDTEGVSHIVGVVDDHIVLLPHPLR